jgi:hypothetical protein
MTMKVNGTTGLTFPDTTTLASAGQSSVQAWVNFNGTGTVAIRASYNVSSITDNGTGDYTVNFTTALADANYAAVFGGARQSGSYNSTVLVNNTNSLYTTSALRISVINFSDFVVDIPNVNVAIFR